MRDAERLSEHTVHLPPLKVGDTVRIQNQTGQHPTKWDKTGIVIEVRQFDQYVIRVDGSGRVTLRNRKFLRKYTPVIQRKPVLMLPRPYHPAPEPGQRPPATPATPAEMPDPPAVLPRATKPEPDTAPATATPHAPPKPLLVKLPRALKALENHNAPGIK